MLELLMLLIFMSSFLLETFILSQKKDEEFERYLRRIESKEKLNQKRKNFEEFKKKIESIKIETDTNEDLFDYNELMERAKYNIQKRNMNTKNFIIEQRNYININYNNFREALESYNSGELQIAFY